MVVVPGLAEGHGPEPAVVAALVAGGVALAAEDVHERVDGEGRVVGEHGADHPAPDEHLPAVRAGAGPGAADPVTEEEQAHVGSDRHHRVEAVEEAQLRELREIGDVLDPRAVVAVGEEPEHVAPPEAVLHRRVRVLGLVRVLVVVPMVGRPPERPALHGARAHEREHELHAAPGAEGAVREVAVVADGDAEHADRVGDGEHGEGEAAHAGQQREAAGQVQGREGQDPHEVDGTVTVRLRARCARVGIEPAHEAGEGTGKGEAAQHGTPAALRPAGPEGRAGRRTGDHGRTGVCEALSIGPDVPDRDFRRAGTGGRHDSGAYRKRRGVTGPGILPTARDPAMTGA